VKNIWVPSIAIPIGVAIVVAVAIIAIGEVYLQLGDGAIILAIILMFVIAGAAAYFSGQTEKK
jgi:hypothetical protein